MNNIKLYEEIKNEPKLGDYVICVEDYDIPQNQNIFAMIIDFTANNVGKIVEIEEGGQFIVKYNNIPKLPKNYVKHPEDDGVLDMNHYFKPAGDSGMVKYKNCRRMFRKEIKHFAPTLEELEMKKTTYEYNL